ncbi:hypothetical protein CsSME_00046713 [Camellia sinensis var. sinensis]
MWVGSLVPLNGGGESDGKRQQEQRETNRLSGGTVPFDYSEKRFDDFDNDKEWKTMEDLMKLKTALDG